MGCLDQILLMKRLFLVGAPNRNTIEKQMTNIHTHLFPTWSSRQPLRSDKKDNTVVFNVVFNVFLAIQTKDIVNLSEVSDGRTPVFFNDFMC